MEMEQNTNDGSKVENENHPSGDKGKLSPTNTPSAEPEMPEIPKVK